MLAAALRRLEDGKCDADRVYAIEQESGARSYTIMSPESAWECTEKKKSAAHIYEVLSSACNMYLDVEWTCAQAPPTMEERQKVSCIVERVKQALLKHYGETHPNVTLVTASGHSTKAAKYKCSWHVHIVCETVCWANAAGVGQFVKEVCADVPEVDKVPYAFCGQNWRCVGSAKVSEPHRCFLPATKQTFLNCTVQQPPGKRKVVYPAVTPTQSIAMLPVPDHVRMLAATLDASTEPVMCSPTVCVLPFREHQFCEHVGRKHKSNHQYAVIDTQLLVWKMRCHACSDAPSYWQPFEDFQAVQRIFKEQTHDYQATAPRPMRCTTSRQEIPAAVTYNLQIVGPPAVVPGALAVQCRDGTYLRQE